MKNQVTLNLVGIDGNAFAIMGAFKNAARKAGWAPDEISEVLNDAMSSDYDHLLHTILKHCKTEYLETYPEEWDEYDNYDNDVHWEDEF